MVVNRKLRRERMKRPTHKVCKACGQRLPVDEFKWNPDDRYLRGGFWHTKCRICEYEAESNAHRN